MNPRDTRQSGIAFPEVSGFRRVLGRGLLKPWLDRLTLRLIGDWYFPCSRGLAAAIAARGEPKAFLESLNKPLPRDAVRPAVLTAVARRHADYEAAEAAWETAFFGPADPAGPAALEATERLRVKTAEALMMARRLFFQPHRRHRLPAVRFELVTPDSLAAAQSWRLADPGGAFQPLAEVKIEESRKMAGRYGRLSWLRFKSSLGDFARARVIEPEGASNPPTLIYLHGVGIETEMWRDSLDPVAALARQGIRVIRPEAPWHGRRALPGYYSGEPVLAWGPKGLIELFHAWVAESAAWIAWAREASTGPVAVSGISLGALTSQLILTAAKAWPQSQRPDAALLIAGSGDIMATAYDGALPRALGLPPKLRAAGWVRSMVEPWRPLLEPIGEPAIAPERIFTLLGTADVVAPFETGLALARRWRLPESNILLRPQGHFTVMLGLVVDPEPFWRLGRLLHRL